MRCYRLSIDQKIKLPIDKVFDFFSQPENLEKITPEKRYLKKNENPPKVNIKFFKDLINVKNINCYSNEGNVWRKSDINFISNNELVILLKEKFQSERGRIYCSLWEEGGKWRWLGIQYVIAEY